MSKGETQPSNNLNSVPEGTGFFEACLSKVIEQDGVILCTPAGIKKATSRREKVIKRPVFDFKSSIVTQATEEEAESLDNQVVSCLIRRHEPAKIHTIAVQQKAVTRSPFVVSLREVMVAHDRPEHKAPVAAQLAYSQSLALPAPGYAALVDATLRSAHEPKLFSKAEDRGANPTVLSLKLAWRKFQMWARDAIKPAVVKAEKAERRIERLVESELEEAAEVAQAKPVSMGRAAIGFVLVAVVMTLPAQALVAYKLIGQDRDNVESQSRQAVEALSGLDKTQDMGALAAQLDRASGMFREADGLLDASHGLAVAAAAVTPSGYRSARALIEVGDKTSAAAGLLMTGLNKIFEDPGRDLVERVEALGAYARGAGPLLADAEKAAATVDPDAVPADKRDQVKDLANQVHAAAQAVREFEALSDLMVNVLGKDRNRTYLLVFQNDTELRPSGGFIGSLAELEIDRGRIASIYVPKGGPYDLKSQLTARLQSPKPLQLINPVWQLQDANWFADFPTTAKKLQWFWGKSGQPSVDGVIAINSSFMPRVLKITGPIDMPQYGKRIDADNFLLETQKAVELEYDKQENAPKKFIGDLFQALMDRTKNLSREEWLKLAAAASDALDTKDIQIAMTRPDEEALIEKFGWNGRLKSTIGDSLAIVGANIAGQKTDGAIKETVYHRADIRSDGSIVDTLRIRREHTGGKGELFRGVRNVQYLRVYVPKGAELISASGFEAPPASLFKKTLETDGKDPDLADIEKTAVQATGTIWQATEGDRTVFGGWLQLDPGRTQDVTLTYRLPMGAGDILAALDATPQAAAAQDGAPRGAYLLLATSQSGKAREMHHEVSAAAPWSAVWARGQVTAAVDEAQNQKQTGAWEGVWDRDRVSASLYALSQPTHETSR